VFGGIIAMNKSIQTTEAEHLASLFLECIVAPDFSAEALQVLRKKKNLRLLRWPRLASKNLKPQLREVKSILGGFLVQDSDHSQVTSEQWRVIGKAPDADILRDLDFAEKIAKSLKSNSIAIVSQGVTLGLGMGQTNRIDSVELALKRARQFHPNTQDWVLASDAFFPFADSIECLSSTPVKWVLQPGGSIKDEEVIQKSKDLGITMILTGERHFKH